MKQLIFKTKFGSHLYGTDTPESDTDYKGVFIEPLENIILGRDSRTVRENTKNDSSRRNTKDDVDFEQIELRRFLKDAMDGQTYALDMLFSPISCWETIQLPTGVWMQILQNREKLLSRNVKPFISYCRKQAGKYGLKGSRLGNLLDAIKYFEGLPQKDKIGDHVEAMPRLEFVHPITKTHTANGKVVPQKFLLVLGKCFSFNMFIKDMVAVLKNEDAKYGERARQAYDNEGVDWKAISHAYRCCYQLIELAETHEIHFPLNSAPRLHEIKTGQVHYSVVQDELPQLMEAAERAIEESPLPKQPDRAFWDKFILDIYLNQ